MSNNAVCDKPQMLMPNHKTFQLMSNGKVKIWFKYYYLCPKTFKRVEAIRFGTDFRDIVGKVKLPYPMTHESFIESAYCENLTAQALAKV